MCVHVFFLSFFIFYFFMIKACCPLVSTWIYFCYGVDYSHVHNVGITDDTVAVHSDTKLLLQVGQISRETKVLPDLASLRDSH